METENVQGKKVPVKGGGVCIYCGWDGGELGLEFEETPLVTRFHQLMNKTGRRKENNRETALAGGEAESQARMGLAGAAVA